MQTPPSIGNGCNGTRSVSSIRSSAAKRRPAVRLNHPNDNLNLGLTVFQDKRGRVGHEIYALYEHSSGGRILAEK
jgi:hypothetical protein